MYASPRTQSANPVRELNRGFHPDVSVEFGNRLNVHELVYVLERLITKDDLALNANDCIISGMPKANRGSYCSRADSSESYHLMFDCIM